VRRPDRRPRGRAWLHAVAFVLLLASAYAQYRGNLDPSLRLVWTSIGLSGLAIVVAVANVVLPVRRPPTPSPLPSDAE
jgi:hypothetical protein